MGSGDGKMIVGLDIGTSKVVAIVGSVTDEGELEIIGIGSHPSRGMKKGVVVNIESTVQSIQRAIEEAGAAAVCYVEAEAATALAVVLRAHLKAGGAKSEAETAAEQRGTAEH